MRQEINDPEYEFEPDARFFFKEKKRGEEALLWLRDRAGGIAALVLLAFAALLIWWFLVEEEAQVFSGFLLSVCLVFGFSALFIFGDDSREEKKDRKLALIIVAVILLVNIPIWPVTATLYTNMDYRNGGFYLNIPSEEVEPVRPVESSLEWHTMTYIAAHGFSWEEDKSPRSMCGLASQGRQVYITYIKYNIDATWLLLFALAIAVSAISDRTIFKHRRNVDEIKYARR